MTDRASRTRWSCPWSSSSAAWSRSAQRASEVEANATHHVGGIGLGEVGVRRLADGETVIDPTIVRRELLTDDAAAVALVVRAL